MAEKTQNFGTSGSLYIVATPIGNLEDLTFRALRILGEVDAIACEDTRQTLKLLNRYNIKKVLISYYQPRESQKIPVILDILKQGKNVALVSDSGTPGISDPGFRLIREALKAGIQVVPIPGPTALAAGLSASGLPTHRFLFIGFPPAKKTAQKKLLLSLNEEPATLIFYLPSRKIIDFLRLSLETLGDRRVVIAREITKVFEEFIRGNIAEILAIVEKRHIKGEMTLLIQGKD
jgi:16S rRNA (cytidine1402-2'-O)-methyltransferase